MAQIKNKTKEEDNMCYVMNDLEDVVRQFGRGRDNNGRYMAYDHCYHFFQENYNTDCECTKDLMTLHLFAYLANWGMLRNSFLMCKDYKFNRPVVDYLCNVQKDIASKKSFDIMEIKKTITSLYKFNSDGKPNTYIEGNEIKEICRVSDILITKILMGTLGITPAYDTYFCKTAQDLGMIQRFGINSYRQLEQFVEANREIIEKLSIEMNYPHMKIVDMYFWQKAINNPK